MVQGDPLFVAVDLVYRPFRRAGYWGGDLQDNLLGPLRRTLGLCYNPFHTKFNLSHKEFTDEF